MAALIGFFGRQPKWLLMSLGLALVVAFGFFDYVTGSELAIDICYLAPVALVTFFVGRWEGQLMSVLGAGAWFLADWMGGQFYSHPMVPVWNVLVRLGSFTLFSNILWSVRVTRERRDDLMHFLVHDLRSPLTNMLYGLEPLLDLAPDRLHEQDRDFVRATVVSCNRLLQLVETLLELARFENGKMPVNLAATDVRELVESSLRNVALWAERKSVVLAPNVAPTVNGVIADRLLASRILINLLANALQANRPGSTIMVNAAPAAGDMVAISVIDQGPGIPREWTGKVFSKFGQVEARKAGGAVGYGLGLTFCRYAVEAQGGGIELVSEVGKGTTVTFTLPAVKPL